MSDLQRWIERRLNGLEGPAPPAVCAAIILGLLSVISLPLKAQLRLQL